MKCFIKAPHDALRWQPGLPALTALNRSSFTSRSNPRPQPRRASRAGSSRNTSRFDFLGDDEVKEVVDFLDGAALGFLAESGVVTGPLCGLLRRWWRRWRRNSTLSAAFAFLEPGDLGPVVAAYFAEDPPLAHAAHAASCDKLRRLERASRSALVDDLSRSLFI